MVDTLSTMRRFKKFLFLFSTAPDLWGIPYLKDCGAEIQAKLYIYITSRCMEYEGITPSIPKLNTRWSWVVSFMSRPVYTHANSCRHPLKRSRDKLKLKVSNFPRIELGDLIRSVRSLLNLPIELPCLIVVTLYYYHHLHSELPNVTLTARTALLISFLCSGTLLVTFFMSLVPLYLRRLCAIRPRECMNE